MDKATIARATAWVAAGATALAITMSPSALEDTKKFEGTVKQGGVHVAYADPAHGWRVPTACFGSTKGVKRGQTFTDAECDARLKDDMERHCAIVADALKGQNISLTQGEIDAYCDLAFNLGQFKNTPSVYGRLVRGDRWGACEGTLKYVYAGKTYMPGLMKRRQAFYQRCISELPL